MAGITFSLGQVVATRGVADALNSLEIAYLLSRHASGDWGDLDCEDKELNNLALSTGKGRLFSSYLTCHGKVWVITEHDRSYTTVLFPHEY